MINPTSRSARFSRLSRLSNYGGGSQKISSQYIMYNTRRNRMNRKNRKNRRNTRKNVRRGGGYFDACDKLKKLICPNREGKKPHSFVRPFGARLSPYMVCEFCGEYCNPQYNSNSKNNNS